MKSILRKIAVITLLCITSTAFAQNKNNFWFPGSSDCEAVCGSKNLRPVTSGISTPHNRPFYVCSIDYNGHGHRTGYNLAGEKFCSIATGKSRSFPESLVNRSGTSVRYSRKNCLCRSDVVRKGNWVNGRGSQDCAKACTNSGLSAVATSCYKGEPHSGKRLHVCSVDAFNRGWRPGFNLEGTGACQAGSGGKSVFRASAKQCLCYDKRLRSNCVSGLHQESPQPIQPKAKKSTITFKRQAPYEGKFYYLARIRIARAKLVSIQNPDLGLGKQWLVQIVKPGSTSDQCGTPGKTVDLKPGETTEIFKGASLKNLLTGFCLHALDNFTFQQGPPRNWSLRFTYTR